MTRKYQKKSASKKKRKKSRPKHAEESVQADGVMSGMVGGFRRVLGAEKSKSKSSTSSGYFWTAVVVIAAIVIIAYNLGR